METSSLIPRTAQPLGQWLSETPALHDLTGQGSFPLWLLLVSCSRSPPGCCRAQTAPDLRLAPGNVATLGCRGIDRNSNLFCDWASACQRGTHGNSIGLRCRCFPKSTDLSMNFPENCDGIEQELNNRAGITRRDRTLVGSFARLLSGLPPQLHGSNVRGRG